MPTKWKCSSCEEMAEFGENGAWWEWIGIQVGGMELTYHCCPKCFAEKMIRSILMIEGMKDDKDEDSTK